MAWSELSGCAASSRAWTSRYSRFRHCTPAMNLDLEIFTAKLTEHVIYCLVNVSGPVFVTVPNSPREVMSVVPVNEVPLTVP